MPFEIVIEKAEAKTDANSKALYGLSEETRRNYNLQEFDLIKMYRVDYRKDEGKGNKKANINEAVIAASVVQKGREKMGKKRTLIGDEVTNLMLMSKRGDESEDYRKPIKHRGNDPVIGAANNELASLTNDAQDLATRGRLMQKSLHQKNDSNTERKRLIKESEHRRKIGQANRSVLPSAMKPHTIEEELDWAIHMTEKNDNLQRDLFRLESEARHIKSGRADDDRSDATEDSASTASKSVRSRKEARIVKNTETHESLQNVSDRLSRELDAMGKTFQKTLINRQRARAQFAALSKKNQEVPEKPSPGKGLNRTSSKESLRSAAVRSSRSTVRGSDKSGTRIGSKAGSKRDYVESVSSTIGPVKIVVNQNLAMLSNRKASFEKALRSFNTDTDSLAKESKEKLLDDITDSTQDEHNIATHIPSLGSSLIPKDTKQISSLITNSRINSFASDITVPSLGPYTPLKPNDPPSSSRRRSRGVSYLPQNELGVALESPNESTSLPPESVDSNDFHGEFLAKILQVDEDNDRALLNSADRNYYFTLDGSKRSSLLADSDSLEVEAEIKLSLGESSENPVSVSESSEARRKKKLELVTCMLDRSYHNTSTELPSKAKVIRKTNTRDNEVIVGEDPFHDSNMDNSTLTVTRYFVSPIGTINSAIGESKLTEKVDSVPYRDFEMKDVARIRRKLDDKELNLAIDRNTLISKIRNLEESGIDKEEKLGSKGKKSAVVVARRSRRAIAHDIKLLTDLSYQYAKKSVGTVNKFMDSWDAVIVDKLEFERQNLLDIESRQFSLPSKLQQRYHEFVMHDEDQSARKNKKITIPLSEAVGYRNIYSSMKSKTFITDDEEFPTTDEFDITTVDDNMKNNRLADQSQDHNIRILSLTSQNLEIIQKFQADLKNRQGVNPNLLAEKYISRNGHINMRKRDYNESNYVYHLKILQDRNEREKIKWENDKILSSEWFLKLLTILKQYKKKRINKKKIPPNIYKFLGSVKEAILMKVELTRQNIWHLMDNVFDEEDFMNNIVYMCIQHVCDTKNISCEAIRSHLKKRGIQPAPKLLMNVKRARKIKSMKKKISTEKKSNQKSLVSLTNKKLLTQPSSLLKRSSPLILPSAPSAQLGGVGLVAKTETPYRVLIGMYNENLKRATTSTLLPILEDDEYAEDDEGEVSKPVLVINEEAVASEEASSPGKKNSTPTTPVEQMVDYEGDEKLNQSFSSDAGSENDSLSSFSFASSDSYDSEADSIFSSGLRNENMDSKDLLNLDLDSWLNL